MFKFQVSSRTLLLAAVSLCVVQATCDSPDIDEQPSSDSDGGAASEPIPKSDYTEFANRLINREKRPEPEWMTKEQQQAQKDLVSMLHTYLSRPLDLSQRGREAGVAARNRIVDFAIGKIGQYHEQRCGDTIRSMAFDAITLSLTKGLDNHVTKDKIELLASWLGTMEVDNETRAKRDFEKQEVLCNEVILAAQKPMNKEIRSRYYKPYAPAIHKMRKIIREVKHFWKTTFARTTKKRCSANMNALQQIQEKTRELAELTEKLKNTQHQRCLAKQLLHPENFYSMPSQL